MEITPMTEQQGIKVYELAKELGVDSISLLDRLGKRRKLVRTLNCLYQRLENPRIFSSR